MIKCLIIDDEPLAAQLLSSYAEKAEQLELLGTFSDPLKALGFIQLNAVDLIFLDIQMPELKGTQLAKIINPGISIIFTTAYPDYAVEGFELKALDYLVKPISFQRFLSAVQRVSTEQKLEQTAASTTTTKDYLFVKTEHRLQRLSFSDILYFQGMGDYVRIYTESTNIMTLENLKSFEEKLPSDQFMRVHKSYLIALEKIDFLA
ncbi:MAG: LytTR family DNA-binding domain-containing protein, partial [Bacteroidota bacterium]